MLYKATCACKEFELELQGEPRIALNCFCNDCVVSGLYINDKAKAATKDNISSVNQEGSANLCAWANGAVTVTKGADKLCGVKCSPTSNTVRSYTSCCYTQVLIGGGDNGSPGMRLVNRATVTRPDGTPFPQEVKHGVGYKTCKRSDWDAVTLPRSKSVPFGVIAGVLPLKCCPCCVTGGMRANPPEWKTLPGLLLPAKEVTDVVPPEKYKEKGYPVPKYAENSMS